MAPVQCIKNKRKHAVHATGAEDLDLGRRGAGADPGRGQRRRDRGVQVSLDKNHCRVAKSPLQKVVCSHIRNLTKQVAEIIVNPVVFWPIFVPGASISATKKTFADISQSFAALVFAK